jgi:hypothetical protein
MSKIENYILHAANEFETTSGKKPNNVYLGEAEIKALRGHHHNYTHVIHDPDIKGDKRLKACGLNVYAVNAVTHIACS